MKQLYAFPQYRFHNTQYGLKPVSERERGEHEWYQFCPAEIECYSCLLRCGTERNHLFSASLHTYLDTFVHYMYTGKEYQYLLRRGTKASNRRPLQVRGIVSRFMFVTYANNFSTLHTLAKLRILFHTQSGSRSKNTPDNSRWRISPATSLGPPVAPEFFTSSW